jgi:acetyl-CoA C-acetyltransferase
MRRVGIIGIGMTKFGELWDKSLREIGIEAGLEAIQDAGISGDDIDAAYVGNMSSGIFTHQEHIAPMFADYAGLTRNNIPATRVEAAGASGGLALRQGYLAVASGMHDIVVVGGAEKMTDVSAGEATSAMATTADQEWEAFFGMTFPGLFAMMAKKHMADFGTTKEQMAMVAVKNHYNGSMNPKAQFRRAIKLEMAVNAPMVADPLGVFDCAAVSDGGAALILCDLEKAKGIDDNTVEIIGSGQASDTISLHARDDITCMKAASLAAKRAYKMSGITAKDIHVAEVHDSHTIAEIIGIEDLGFFERGKGGKGVEDGKTALDGEIPVNTSGGLKAKGHPMGATGIAQAVEIVQQLRGEAGDRQIKDAEVGLAHSVGGSGATGVVHIFKRGW